MTVTPIFGDNMSPTGFGSVPCERIEMLLDGERLGADELAGWRPQHADQLRQRPGAAAAGCRSAGATGASNGGRGRRCFGGAAAADARALQDDRGHAQGRRHVPGDEPRAAARSRQALHAIDACRPAQRPATRSSRTSARSASRGRSTRRQAKDSPSRRKDLHLHAEDGG